MMSTTETIEDAFRDRQTRQNILVKCVHCRALLYVRDWERNLKICQECGYHFRLTAAERIASLVDGGSFVEIDAQIRSGDPLRFSSQSHTYREKLTQEQGRTGLNEAVMSGTGCIAGHALALAVMDFHFIGGSMGSVVGEKVTRAIEQAREKRLPLLIISASGGARMQEGILSLMQMAKTSVALAHLSEARLPFISLLTDPTTGGVTASFAMQGDIILAEQGALVGFAGPRVIEQFLHQKLPKDASTAEFLLEHGMIDAVVPRSVLRSTLAHLLDYYSIHSQWNTEHKFFTSERGVQQLAISLRQQRHPGLRGNTQTHPLQFSSSTSIRERASAGYQSMSTRVPTVSSPGAAEVSTVEESEGRHDESRWELHPWDQVQLARHRDRPQALDYIRLLCMSFFELQGDRRYANDPAILGGLATFAERTIMLIGHQKGRDSRQRQACNSGMPHPEGYRKAQRLMRHAEKFGFPVVCLIDTPGAFPGLEAEQRGQAQAIAESLAIMTTLRVPIVAVVIGEGGSGGALALGLADRVLMLEHSIYTVASPEAAASILWRDNKLAAQAAEAMRITALDLLDLGVIDGIIPEPAGGAHHDHVTSAQLLAQHMHKLLNELARIPIADLVAQRHSRFRNPGRFSLV